MHFLIKKHSYIHYNFCIDYCCFLCLQFLFGFFLWLRNKFEFKNLLINMTYILSKLVYYNRLILLIYIMLEYNCKL